MTEAELDAMLAAVDPTLAFPPSFRAHLAGAIAREQADGRAAAAATLAAHYGDTMPRMRVAQLAPDGAHAALFHTSLDWARLPRLARALDRLDAVLGEAGVAFRVPRAPTLAALYATTHYGGFMPLLYGYPADLAYFASRGERGDVHTTIDRYLTAPIIHEACHLARDRRRLLPIHLDECLGGWLGVHVHPEFAYPAPGEDDAIFAAPWLAQVGQAIVRAFGLAAAIRTHAGVEAALPADFLAAAHALAEADWATRRSVHFLADTFDPEPWLALVLDRPMPDDPAFDRAIVADGLRAMCLETTQVAGSFRTRVRVPTTVTIDASSHRMSAERRGLDPVAPRYWLPRSVHESSVVRVTDLGTLPEP